MPPKSRGNSESENVRAQLDDIFSAATGPNPLETLGLTPDAVEKLLPGDALDMAVKGLYRAYNVMYHPDTQVGGDTSEDPRMRPVKAAYEAFKSDPAKIRDDYLKQARQKRQKPIGGKQSDRSSTSRTRRSSMVSSSQQAWIEILKNDLYSSNMFRVEEADLLLRPMSFMNDAAMPPESLHIDQDMRLSTTTYFMADSIDDLPQSLIDNIEINNDVERVVGIFVKNGEVNIPNRFLLPGANPQDLGITEDGWYEIRGIVDKNGVDKRSLQIYKPTGKAEEKPLENHRLVGSFPFEKWQSLRSELSSRNRSERKLLAGDIYDARSQSPNRDPYRRIASAMVRSMLIADTHDSRLAPRIDEGRMLVSTRAGEEFYVLGRIDQLSVKYHGSS